MRMRRRKKARSIFEPDAKVAMGADGGHSILLGVAGRCGSCPAVKRLLQMLVHNERIDEAQSGMQERQGQSTYHFKTVGLPRPDRALVRADDEVELHGSKATLPGM